MIVCLCRVVTDRAVRDAIDSGAQTAEEVGHRCGAGTGCGACKGVVEEILEQSRCGSCPRRAREWSPYSATAAPEAA